MDQHSKAQGKLLNAGHLRPLQGPTRFHLITEEIFSLIPHQKCKVGSFQGVSGKDLGHQAKNLSEDALYLLELIDTNKGKDGRRKKNHSPQ